LVDSISLLCRGKSLASVNLLPNVDECIIVNAFHNELKIKDISDYIRNCNITHLCSLDAKSYAFEPMISMGIYEKYNINKIILPYIDDCCKSIPNYLKNIKNRKNYVDVSCMSDKNKNDMSINSGMNALLYCINDLGKKNINIIGLDFYENVGYLTNSHGLEYVSDEQAIETAASNGDTTEYVKSFFIDLVSKNLDINFNLYTKSPTKLNLSNLRVVKV
jgi:hypothetical protein